jgi:hypothetical protein
MAAVGEDGKEHKACVVQTRLKHPGLLVDALHSVGAKATLGSDGSISGTWEGIGFRFVHHEDGTLSAHFDPDVNVGFPSRQPRLGSFTCLPRRPL